ncbi:hypothetical protein [Acanthopleuribacter pedis]|uniref:Uncharacterized protein n=1 Tax=Acanthopleuribacter pedis TaxID=442870 RepID=A0A8J7U732_9BACT|nr:hypothetical protein [Acanthopleuribacter pedis]MBO1320991.1 hypothetical protein [Acanthopleuribacter pedis]
MMFPRWMMSFLVALLTWVLSTPPGTAEDDPLVTYHLGVYLETDQPAAVQPALQLDWPAFQHLLHTRWDQGYQVVDLEIAPDNEHFSAVFGWGSAKQEIRVGATQAAFAQHLTKQTQRGFTLTDLEVTRDPHGRMRYAGVWTHLDEPRLVSYNMSYSQFMNLNAARQAMGWELVDVESAASEALTFHYAAIWQAAGAPTLWIAPTSWPDFHATYHDLHGQGFRLIDMEQQADGRYFGVFVASCAPDYLWAGRTFMGSPAGVSELSGPMLGPEHLIDYEVIQDPHQSADHPEKTPPGRTACGWVDTLNWGGLITLLYTTINEYPLQADIDGIPKNLRLHNTGSAGPED